MNSTFKTGPRIERANASAGTAVRELCGLRTSRAAPLPDGQCERDRGQGPPYDRHHDEDAKLRIPRDSPATYAGIINSKLANANGANAKDVAATSDTADTWFLSHSAGSGPFVLDSYKADDALRLKRNDNYWGKKPAIAEVIMKQTADAMTQAQMLQSGAADVAMQIDPDRASRSTTPISSSRRFLRSTSSMSPSARSRRARLSLCRTMSERRSPSLSTTRARSISPSGVKASCSLPPFPTGSRARPACLIPRRTSRRPKRC